MARPEGSGDGSSNNGSGQQSQRQQSLRRRFLGPGVLPLARGSPPSQEATVEEGTHLFNSFLYEELERAEVQPPQLGIDIPTTNVRIAFASPLTDGPGLEARNHGDSDVCFDAPDTTLPESLPETTRVATQRPSNYRRLGRDIRRYADEFAKSDHGQKIKEKANEVDLACLDYQSLQEILSGVFYDGQFSITTVVAVFVFSSTLVIRALRDPVLRISKNIINWCFKFIQDGVCTVVQREGGWEAVVDGMVGQLFKIGSTLLIASAALCALFFLWRK